MAWVGIASQCTKVVVIIDNATEIAGLTVKCMVSAHIQLNAAVDWTLLHSTDVEGAKACCTRPR